VSSRTTSIGGACCSASTTRSPGRVGHDRQLADDTHEYRRSRDGGLDGVSHMIEESLGGLWTARGSMSVAGLLGRATSLAISSAMEGAP
jgi:hypothetical protein